MDITSVCGVVVSLNRALPRTTAVGIWSALMVALALGTTPSLAGALFIVNQPWVRPAKIAQTTEAYMNLTSTDGGSLVAVSTAAAKEAAIRAPGKSTINAPSVRLPAGTLVALAPGHYRVVLKQLLKALQPGDRVPMTLRVDLDDGSHQEIAVDAEVRLRSPIDDERRAHSHAHSPQ
jgi:periplasmic copper chaperone A